MTISSLLLRIGLAFALGALVGVERQWRARMAGLRTNAIVSLGAALFVIMGAYSFHGDSAADPTRVAAQIVSGIGFLGAGVIMKQGNSITGLNTAATLWATAAVGALCGGGLFLPATVGAMAIMIANTVLRPVGRMMDRQPAKTGRELPPAEYIFEVSCHEEAEAHVRRLIVSAIARPEFRLHSVHSTHNLKDGDVDVVAELSTEERNDQLLEEAMSRLSLEPMVTYVSWKVDPVSNTFDLD